MPKTKFIPKQHGYHYPNRYDNPILPHVLQSSRGRCGGMSFLAIDHFVAGIPVPTHSTAIFEQTYHDTSRAVPGDGSKLADGTFSRLLDTFEANGDKWAFVFSTPVIDEMKTIERLGKAPPESAFSSFMAGELATIRQSIDGGNPIPIGLVASTKFWDAGQSHQVVCYGYDLVGADQIKLYIYDCNLPDQDVEAVTTIAAPTGLQYTAGAGNAWAGFLASRFTAKAPSYWDLVLWSGISISPAKIHTGEGASFQLTIKNCGEFDAQLDAVRLVVVPSDATKPLIELHTRELKAPANTVKAGATSVVAASIPVLAGDGKALEPGWYEMKAQYKLVTTNPSPDVWYDLIAAGSSQPRPQVHVMRKDEADKDVPPPAETDTPPRLPEQTPPNNFGAPEGVKKVLHALGLDKVITPEMLMLAQAVGQTIEKDWPAIQRALAGISATLGGGVSLSAIAGNPASAALANEALALGGSQKRIDDLVKDPPMPAPHAVAAQALSSGPPSDAGPVPEAALAASPSPSPSVNVAVEAASLVAVASAALGAAMVAAPVAAAATAAASGLVATGLFMSPSPPGAGKPQGRLGDNAAAPPHGHGCLSCPHPVVGPAVSGSPDVMVNGRPALRQDDQGTHASCCGPNTWQAAGGSGTVRINGKPAHRVGDQTRHCEGAGQGILTEGSNDVLIGG